MSEVPKDPRNELVKALRDSSSDALSVVENFHDFFNYIGREVSRRQEHSYLEPFKCLSTDIKLFDSVIRKALADFNILKSVLFDCDIELNNRKIISCQEISEIDNLPEIQESYPDRLQIVWSYFYDIQWKGLEVPVPYKIILEYSINPRKDVIGMMNFVTEPQQYIFLSIEGPPRIIQVLYEEINAVIKSTFIPWWWRYPKKGLQLLEPYLGVAIYGAATATIFVVFDYFSDINEANLKQQILAERESYFRSLAGINKKRQETLSEILRQPNIEEKFDLYVEYELQPYAAETFIPIEELFEEDSILPTIGYIFLLFLFAGILHILFLQLYRRLTPPSVIALGKLGQRKLRLSRLYDWLGGTLMAAGVVPALGFLIIRVITILFQL